MPFTRLKDDVIRQMARDAYAEEGRIEFDDEPALSIEEHNPAGAYVAAWVWVDFEEEDDEDDEEARIGTQEMYRRQEGRGDL